MITDNTYYLYLTWPQYLAQWYAHEMYRLAHFEDTHLEPYMYNSTAEIADMDVVETRRGSVERNVLEMCLAKQPSDCPPKIPPTTTIKIAIPNFLHKPAIVYNYLSPASEMLLTEVVRNQFQVALYRYIMKVNPLHQTGMERCIEVFMENNGIEYNETNIESIRKVWARCRGRARVAKFREKNKKQ